MSTVQPDYYEKSVTSTNECTLELSEILGDLRFNLGNIIKYIVRHNEKNGKEDLRKALRYAELEESHYESAENCYSFDTAMLKHTKYTGLLSLVMESFTDEEKLHLANQGADLALALLALVWVPHVANIRYALIDIVNGQLQSVTEPVEYSKYGSFSAFYALASDEDTKAMDEWFEFIKENLYLTEDDLKKVLNKEEEPEEEKSEDEYKKEPEAATEYGQKIMKEVSDLMEFIDTLLSKKK